jgi:hypothetical protein
MRVRYKHSFIKNLFQLYSAYVTDGTLPFFFGNGRPAFAKALDGKAGDRQGTGKEPKADS